MNVDGLLQIAKDLAISNFDLAFEVLHAYGISSAQTYTAAAKGLAEQGNLEAVQELLHSMKSTSTDQEYDQVRGMIFLLLPQHVT